MKPCPHCAEQIQEAAAKCHICGEWLRRSSPWISIGKWLAQDGKAFLGLAALAIYAVVRVALDSFYGRLAVTAEEVGLTQATIIARAALYFGFFLAGLVAIEGTAFAVTTALLAWRASRASRQEKRGAAATKDDAVVTIGSLVPLFLLALPYVVQRATPHFYEFLASSVLGVAASLLAMLLLAAGAGVLVQRFTLTNAISASQTAEAGQDHVLSRRAFQLGLVAAVTTLTVLTLMLASQLGENLAARAKDGMAFRTSRFNLLSLSADPVCLNWSGSPHLELPIRPYLYLGQSNSTLVLYDYDTSYRRPLRIPAGEVALSIADPVDEATGKWKCPSASEGLQGDGS